MKVTTALYISSNAHVNDCPPADKPEFAFIGRSNVGKSSLINMLCGVHNLARVASRPGKTQIINHFLINKFWYLVDLPGYGYAKVSKEKRAGFDKMISGYILGRKNLICLFVLIDIRIPPQELDLQFMGNLSESGIPFCMVFTKADKLSKTAGAKAVASYHQKMQDEWDELPQHFITSAEKGTGRDEVLTFIEENSKL